MDIRVQCQGSTIDHRKPGTTLFNYDEDPPNEMIQAHLLGYVSDYRDDINTYEHNQSAVTLNLDTVMGEGVATVHLTDEEFQLRLFINPDIQLGSPVRVSAHESPHHGAYGILVDASGTANVWTVEMLEGGTVHFEREELADVARFTSVDRGNLANTPDMIPMYAIGEIAEYVAANKPNKVVRITRRRYTSSDFSWSYSARPVDGSTPEYDLDERNLRPLPFNLQNLQILERQG